MSVRIAPQQHIDGLRQRPARNATGALALAIASRFTLVVLAIAGIGVAIVALDGRTRSMSFTAAPAARISSADVADEGSRIADIVRAMEDVDRQAGVDVVWIEIGRPAGRRAPISVALDLATDGVEMPDVLDAVADSGVIGPFPGSVIPVSAGLRSVITGDVDLSVARLPASRRSDVPLAVALAGDVERSGGVLRRLDVEQRDDGLVRLEVDGTSQAVVLLVDRIERLHAAPVRFASVSIRRVESGLRRLTVVFRPRGAR